MLVHNMGEIAGIFMVEFNDLFPHLEWESTYVVYGSEMVPNVRLPFTQVDLS